MGNANSGRRPDHERHRQVIRLRERGLTLAESGLRLGYHLHAARAGGSALLL